MMIWLFVFGACIGSFLNVCIHRLPRDLSLAAPGSQCPECRSPIRWYDNIPLVSYALLGGRCRYCQGGISARYAGVEALTGLLFVWLYYWFCLRLHRPVGVFVVYAALTAALIAATFIDFDFHIIPNEITFSGIALAPAASFLAPEIHGAGLSRWAAVGHSLVGVLVGGGVVLAVALIGQVIFRKEAMGLGDVKLMAFVGGVTGWQVAVIAFFVAPFFGLLMGIPNWIRKGRHVIPYGPFLSLATLIVLCWKPHFLHFVAARVRGY